MITSSAFAGQHYAVLGLARSGLASVEALLASGAKVTAWDDDQAARAKLSSPAFAGEGGHVKHGDGVLGARRTPPPHFVRSPSPGKPGEDLVVAPLDDLDLSQFDALVVSPGIPLNRHPIAAAAKAAGVEIIGDIELFARARAVLPPHKVVGITGTNGKSTTTALVHHILKTAGVPSLMGGNIGLPILAQDPLPEGGVYVLELSSYQLDLTQTLDCDVAVLLNVTPDHLDRYENFEAYAASKARLFEMQSAGHNSVVDVWSASEYDVLAGPNQKPGVIASCIEDVFDFKPFTRKSQRKWGSLQGPHNLHNAMAAIEICDILGLSTEQIDSALHSFSGLPHRMERIRKDGGVLFVNDSKATNPTATAPALAAFPAIRWILGGQAKSDNLDDCASYFSHVRKAYTIGEASSLFASLLKPHMAVAECGTLGAAVKVAAADAEPGDTVLLSPACASFDQFTDFEARGDAFRALVEAL